MANHESNQFYYSDAAKISISEDDLGWQGHVTRVTKAVKAVSGASGYVIGITGNWGTGKTSFLNFTIEELRRDTEVRVFVFNPWTYPKFDLAAAFFWDLSKVLGKKTRNVKYSEAAKRCRRLGTALSTVPSGINFGTNFTNVVLSSLLVSMPWIVWGPLGFSALWVLAAIGVASSLLFMVDKHLALKGEELSALAKEAETLDQLKRELSEELRDPGETIVVVVDDIDRLPPNQMCEVFQIVKNNGDLPRLVYLLGYDKAIVEHTLSTEYGPLYRSFVDKIVQMEFGLPPVERIYLDKYVETELGTIIDTLPSSWKRQWSRARWSNYYLESLRWFFASIRDAKRLLNAVRINVEAVLGGEAPEVNIIDFLTIEFIRIKYPRIYGNIRDNKRIFVGSTSPSEFLPITEVEMGEHRKSFSRALDEIVDEGEKRRVRELLEDLFPRLKSLHSISSTTYEATDADRIGLRICDGQTFDRYFVYGNYLGDLANADVEGIISDLGRENEVQTRISKLVHRDPSTASLRSALDLIRARCEESDDLKGNESEIVQLIFDSSDLLRDDLESTFGTPVRLFIPYAVRSVLANSDQSQRLSVLRHCTKRSIGYFGPVMVVAVLSAKDASEHERGFLSTSGIEELKRIVLGRCEKWLGSRLNVEHPHFTTILHYLKEWMPKGQYEMCIRLLIQDSSASKMLIARFQVRTEAIKYGGQSGEISYRYDYDHLARLVDIDLLFEASSHVGASKDDSKEVADALERFRKGFQEWKSVRLPKSN